VLQSTLQQLTSSDFSVSTGLIHPGYWGNSTWYFVNVERGDSADKLQPRNINVSFQNNSNVHHDSWHWSLLLLNRSLLLLNRSCYIVRIGQLVSSCLYVHGYNPSYLTISNVQKACRSGGSACL